MHVCFAPILKKKCSPTRVPASRAPSVSTGKKVRRRQNRGGKPLTEKCTVASAAFLAPYLPFSPFSVFFSNIYGFLDNPRDIGILSSVSEIRVFFVSPLPIHSLKPTKKRSLPRTEKKSLQSSSIRRIFLVFWFFSRIVLYRHMTEIGFFFYSAEISILAVCHSRSEGECIYIHTYETLHMHIYKYGGRVLYSLE